MSPLQTWHPQTLQGLWPLSPLRQEQLPWRSHLAIHRVKAQEDPCRLQSTPPRGPSSASSRPWSGEACGAMHGEGHGAR